MAQMAVPDKAASDAAAKVVFAAMDRQSKINGTLKDERKSPAAGEGPPEIQFHNVVFAYPSNAKAVVLNVFSVSGSVAGASR